MEQSVFRKTEKSKQLQLRFSNKRPLSRNKRAVNTPQHVRSSAFVQGTSLPSFMDTGKPVWPHNRRITGFIV